MREPVKPTVDFPMSDAMGELTGFETQAVKKKLKVSSLEQTSEEDILPAVVWVLENRTRETTWDEVMNRRNYELTGYFAPASTDPDDEPGKDGPPARPPTGTSPNGSSVPDVPSTTTTP